MSNNKNTDKKNFYTITKVSLITIPILTVFIASMINPYNAFSQPNGAGGDLPTFSEQLEEANEFSQVVLSSSQIDALSDTINNATQAAEEGNMTSVIIQLRVLQNQIELIQQEAIMFGP